MLRVFVDGKAILTGTDKRREKAGNGHNHVGFYFYTNAKIDNIKVYVKKAAANDLDLD